LTAKLNFFEYSKKKKMVTENMRYYW